MNDRALELLPEYVLGSLSLEDATEVEAALSRSPELRAECAAIEDALFAVADSVPHVAPSSAAKDRLMAQVAGSDRFLPFAKDLARYCDLAAEKIRELFRLIDDPGAWEETGLPGILAIHFAGGPNAMAADTGFVRLPAGLEFPQHTHQGFEVNYILEGRIVDGDGKSYGPGEAIIKDETQQHCFWVPDDAPTLIAVIQSGFDIIGPYDGKKS